MLKFTSASIVGLKIFFLFCVSGMGLSDVLALNALKTPCHQEVSQSVKDCNQCEEALLTYAQDFVSKTEISVNEAESEITDSSNYLNFAVKAPENNFKFVYRPPPKVIFLTAFFQPKKMIELVV